MLPSHLKISFVKPAPKGEALVGEVSKEIYIPAKLKVKEGIQDSNTSTLTKESNNAVKKASKKKKNVTLSKENVSSSNIQIPIQSDVASNLSSKKERKRSRKNVKGDGDVSADKSIPGTAAPVTAKATHSNDTASATNNKKSARKSVTSKLDEQINCFGDEKKQTGGSRDYRNSGRDRNKGYAGSSGDGGSRVESSSSGNRGGTSDGGRHDESDPYLQPRNIITLNQQKLNNVGKQYQSSNSQNAFYQQQVDRTLYPYQQRSFHESRNNTHQQNGDRLNAINPYKVREYTINPYKQRPTTGNRAIQQRNDVNDPYQQRPTTGNRTIQQSNDINDSHQQRPTTGNRTIQQSNNINDLHQQRPTTGNRTIQQRNDVNDSHQQRSTTGKRIIQQRNDVNNPYQQRPTTGNRTIQQSNDVNDSHQQRPTTGKRIIQQRNHTIQQSSSNQKRNDSVNLYQQSSVSGNDFRNDGINLNQLRPSVNHSSERKESYQEKEGTPRRTVKEKRGNKEESTPKLFSCTKNKQNNRTPNSNIPTIKPPSLHRSSITTSIIEKLIQEKKEYSKILICTDIKCSKEEVEAIFFEYTGKVEWSDDGNARVIFEHWKNAKSAFLGMIDRDDMKIKAFNGNITKVSIQKEVRLKKDTRVAERIIKAVIVSNSLNDGK